MERMENDRITKKIYVGEYVDSQSIGKLQKRWVNTIKDCLRNKGLDIKLARRMEQGKSK